MESKNKLFSIYGARYSKNKDRINISIVTGDDKAREWGTISIKLEDSKKIKVAVKDGCAYLKVPFLEDLKKVKKEEVKTDDLPF